MADENRDETIEPEGGQPAPGPTDSDEADVEGHSMLLYEQARSHARDRSREADDWARREALRRQAKERKPERR